MVRKALLYCMLGDIVAPVPADETATGQKIRKVNQTLEAKV